DELEQARCAARRVVRGRVVAALAPRDAQQLIGVGTPGDRGGADDALDLGWAWRYARADVPHLGHRLLEDEARQQGPLGLGAIDDLDAVGVVGETVHALAGDERPPGDE